MVGFNIFDIFKFGFSGSGGGSVSAWIALNGNIATDSGGIRYITNDGNIVISSAPIANYEEAYNISGTTWYLDHDATGANDGTSPTDAFTSVGDANDDLYSGGDALLIKAGNVFETSLTMTSSGEDGNHVLIGAYGDINLPLPIFDSRIELTGLVWNPHPTAPDVYIAVATGGGRMWYGGKTQEFELESAFTYNDNYMYDMNSQYTFDSNNGEIRYYHEGGTPPTSGFYVSSYYAMRSLNTRFMSYYDIDFRGGSSGCYIGGDVNNLNFTRTRHGKYSGNGIKIRDGIDGAKPHTILFDNCIIDSDWKSDLTNAYRGGNSDTRGCEEGISIKNWCEGVEIRHTKFYNWGHHHITAEPNPLTTEEIKDFYIHHCYINNKNSDYGSAIMMNDNVVDFVFSHNIVEGTNSSYANVVNPYIGFNIFRDSTTCSVRDATNKSGGNGFGVHAGDLGTDSGIIENNIFYNLLGAGIHLQAYHDDIQQSIRGLDIRNNIIYNCGRGGTWGGQSTPSINALYIEAPYGAAEMHNIDVRNNVIITDGPEDVITCNGVDYATVEAFNLADTGIGLSSGNTEVDPQFIDTVNFILDSGSPLIGAGLMPSKPIDYNGNAITAPYDIGMYQSGTAEDVFVPSATDVEATTGQMLDFGLYSDVWYVNTKNPFVDGDSISMVADFKLDADLLTNRRYRINGNNYGSNGMFMEVVSGVMYAKVYFDLLSATSGTISAEFPNFDFTKVHQIGAEISSEHFLNLYFDGEIVASRELTTGDILSISSSRNFAIGSGDKNDSNPFQGSIGNHSYWFNTIGATAVKELYDLKERALYKRNGEIVTDGEAISPNNLVMWFPMIEGTGSNIIDEVDGTTYAMNNTDATASWLAGRGESGGLQTIAINRDATLPNTMSFDILQDSQIVSAVPTAPWSVKEVCDGDTYIWDSDGYLYKNGGPAIPFILMHHDNLFMSHRLQADEDGIGVVERTSYKVYSGIIQEPEEVTANAYSRFEFNDNLTDAEGNSTATGHLDEYYTDGTYGRAYDGVYTIAFSPNVSITETFPYSVFISVAVDATTDDKMTVFCTKSGSMLYIVNDTFNAQSSPSSYDYTSKVEATLTYGTNYNLVITFLSATDRPKIYVDKVLQTEAAGEWWKNHSGEDAVGSGYDTEGYLDFSKTIIDEISYYDFEATQEQVDLIVDTFTS